MINLFVFVFVLQAADAGRTLSRGSDCNCQQSTIQQQLRPQQRYGLLVTKYYKARNPKVPQPEPVPGAHPRITQIPWSALPPEMDLETEPFSGEMVYEPKRKLISHLSSGVIQPIPELLLRPKPHQRIENILNSPTLARGTDKKINLDGAHSEFNIGPKEPKSRIKIIDRIKFKEVLNNTENWEETRDAVRDETNNEDKGEWRYEDFSDLYTS